MTVIRPLLVTTLSLALLPTLAGQMRAAQQDEIQVYADEINKPGELTLQMHVNGTPSGVKTPGFQGESLTNRGLRLSPEFAYGLTKDIEFGLYFPEAAVDKDGNWIFSGTKLRLKYLPLQPDEEKGGFYAGGNLELSDIDRHLEQARYIAEMRFISGYRGKDWMLAFDPVFDWKLSDGVASATPDFNYGIKTTRQIVKGLDLGLEYYSDLGQIDHVKPWNQQDNRIYGIVDIDMKPFNINFGVGYGLTSAADRWTIKTIFDVPFTYK